MNEHFENFASKKEHLERFLSEKEPYELLSILEKTRQDLDEVLAQLRKVDAALARAVTAAAQEDLEAIRKIILNDLDETGALIETIREKMQKVPEN